MTARRKARRRTTRISCAATAALLGSGALAAGAGAASVKLTMPSQVKKGSGYTIKIDGSYKKSELKGKAFLISLIQFANHPCKATAQAENRTKDFIQYYFAPKNHPQNVGIFEKSSPFTRTDGFTAGETGTRHVCTYLYPKFIQPSDTTKPIARADKKYSVTR